jgi:hypothetical protein
MAASLGDLEADLIERTDARIALGDLFEPEEHADTLGDPTPRRRDPPHP